MDIIERLISSNDYYADDAIDEIRKLRNAIESMRTAGGLIEFQRAFDMAKSLIPIRSNHGTDN